MQYAHARIASVLAKAAEEGLSSEGADASLLQHEAEQTLLRKLMLLPEVMQQVAETLEPQPLPHYSTELAAAFHVFYTQCRVIDEDDEALSRARLLLMEATQVVLARALGLMGLSAPDQM